uniref:Protein with SprT-like domain at the N terminus n=1 Tax=Cacopsylla melanoneura TaxID=428564 RepID=A0A8D9DSC8_9HEMI
MSKKQKIDPDYFLALTLQRKFNEEYKKEKDVKTNRSQDVVPLPSCSSHEFPVSPVRKKPLGSAILIDPLPFTSHPRPPVTLSKPPLTNPKSLPSLPKSSSTPFKSWSQSPSRPLSLNDSQWEVIDPTPDVHGLFVAFGKRFFQDRLGSVEVKWSKRMTTCAGVCRFKGRRDRFGRGIGEVAISLSEPLLKLRPRSDLVNTLLHEMIHAYLFLFTENPNRADRDDHGQEFQQHMQRINKEAGTKITIYHSFHDEVKLYKTHWWQCNGPCKARPPFYGLVKRATNRAPGKSDFWFANHQAECGGQFIKIKEPENFKARGPRKNKENMISGSAGSPNIGGRVSNKGGPSAGTSTGGNIVGFGGSPLTNSKHVPTPGQPKIVGFVDLSKQGGSNKGSPGDNAFGTNSASRTTNGANAGGYTLGTNPKTTTSFGRGALASNTGGNNSGRTLGSSNGSKLGTPGNNRSNTPNRGPANTNRFPGTGLNNQAGPSGQRPSNPIGSKLLDKLRFDSKNGNSGSFGGNSNYKNGNTNANNSNKNANRGNEGTGSNRGFGGGMTGTRMNKGSGTVVLNPKKGGTMTSPNETTERITKPINKTEKVTPSTENSKTVGTDENRLNIDNFKPFMGQGQALGGSSGGTDPTRSRLLANVGASSRGIGNSSGSNGRNNYGDSRNNARSSGNNDWNSRHDDGNGSRNKKPCLGNRSLYSSGEPSTSQFNGSMNSPNKIKPYHSSSNSNSSCKKPSSSNASTPGKMDLSWELSDDVMDGDYEFERVNSRFTQPSNDKNGSRTDNEIVDLDEIDDGFEHMETNRDTEKTRNHVAVNLDDSFEEMENMMNDSDIEVFGNISDEILSGSIGNTGGSARDNSSSGMRNAINASTSRYNGPRDENNHATSSKHNDSLDDMFEMSSEDENNGYDDENNDENDNGGGDDETHCPVCNKPIARASMGDHLENCMELSQVFDNVVIDDDDEEDDEFTVNDSNVENRNKPVDKKQIVRDNDVGNGNKTPIEDKSESSNRESSNGKCRGTNRDRPDETGGKTSDRKHDREPSANPVYRYNKMEQPQQNRNETKGSRHDQQRQRDRNGDTRNDAGPSPIKVKCPICNADIFESTANEHIDECLVRNIAQDLE